MRTIRPHSPGRPGLALLALGVALASCSPSGETEPDEIRVGHVCGGIDITTVATNADTYPDSVNVDKICFEGGAEAVQALIGGSLDVFIGSTEHILNTRDKGLDVKGYAAIADRAPYHLVAASGSGIDDIADLESRTVAVTSPGSLSDTELHQAALDAGISYDDLEVVGAGSGAGMTAALSEGGSAAGMVSEPQLSEMLESGDYERVWSPDFHYASLVAISSESWVADNQESMAAYLEGLSTAESTAREDTDFVLDNLKDEGFEVDDDVLARGVEEPLDRTPEGLSIDEEVYTQTLEVLTGVGKLDEGDAPDFDDVFDLDLLPAS